MRTKTQFPEPFRERSGTVEVPGIVHAERSGNGGNGPEGGNGGNGVAKTGLKCPFLLSGTVPEAFLGVLGEKAVICRAVTLPVLVLP